MLELKLVKYYFDAKKYFIQNLSYLLNIKILFMEISLLLDYHLANSQSYQELLKKLD